LYVQIRCPPLGARKGLVANLHSQIRCSPMHPGLQRKAHRKAPLALFEDLQRKAWFLALCAKNAPEDSRFPIGNLL
jgi:hypothetical protein